MQIYLPCCFWQAKLKDFFSYQNFCFLFTKSFFVIDSYNWWNCHNFPHGDLRPPNEKLNKTLIFSLDQDRFIPTVDCLSSHCDANHLSSLHFHYLFEKYTQFCYVWSPFCWISSSSGRSSPEEFDYKLSCQIFFIYSFPCRNR